MVVVDADRFERGIDVVTPSGEIERGFTPFALNFTNRGTAAAKRPGTARIGTPGATAKYVYFSPAYDSTVFTQEGTGFYKYSLAPVMTARTLLHTFSSSAKVHACTFGGRVIVVHPVDGVWRSDAGATTLAVATAAVLGSTCAVWQNKVWVGGDPTNKSRLMWCAAGDATTWTTATDFVDLRDVDESVITCLGSGNGMDVIGRAGLYAFKNNSAYRVIDSETGEYVTVDTAKGASGAEAVTSGVDGVYVCNRTGIYRIEDAGLLAIDDPIHPLWDIGVYVIGDGDIAWSSWGRHYFCSAETPTRIWEYVPQTKAWWLHQLNKNNVAKGVMSASSWTDGNAGPPNPQAYLLDSDGLKVLASWAAVSGGSYQTFDYGADGDYPITGKIRTPWVTLNQMKEFRISRARARVWDGSSAASWTLNTYHDYDATTATAVQTAFVAGTTPEQALLTWNQLGVHRAVQLEFIHAGGAIAQRTAPDGSTYQAEAAGVSGVELDIIPLGT